MLFIDKPEQITVKEGRQLKDRREALFLGEDA